MSHIFGERCQHEKLPANEMRNIWRSSNMSFAEIRVWQYEDVTFFAQRFKWIVKWGTQESHHKEKKYGNIGTDLQLQEDTFFIIESAKFVLFIFFFLWLVFLFCSFTHGLFLFWHRREKRGNTCTRVNTINKIKVFHRKPVRKPFDAKKSHGSQAVSK